LDSRGAIAGAPLPAQSFLPPSDASTLDDPNQEHDKCDDQKDVNEPAQGV
jgi:hypothetical protein